MSNLVRAQEEKVIAVYSGDEVSYFTISGIHIGTLKGGKLLEKAPEPKPIATVKSAVVRPISPQAADRLAERSDEELTLTQKLRRDAVPRRD